MIEPEAYLSAAVKVYPFKTIEAGAVVNTSVIWESRGQRTLFGPRGVSGLVNVEVTPELAVRLASAYATMLRKGSTVTTSRDVSRAARALKRAVQGALNASAINVVDLEAQPLPVARFETARDHYSGGVALRTTPGDPQSIDIIFLDERGAELSQDPRVHALDGVRLPLLEVGLEGSQERGHGHPRQDQGGGAPSPTGGAAQ